MANYQINMVRGDSLSFGLVFEGLNQELDDMVMTCKKNDTDEQVVFQKTIGSGITEPNPHEYVVRVAPEDTKELETGNYHFDVQIKVNGDVFTPLIGILIIEQDTTWEVSE